MSSLPIISLEAPARRDAMSAAGASGLQNPTFSLIELFLRDQQDLSAVERFAHIRSGRASCRKCVSVAAARHAAWTGAAICVRGRSRSLLGLQGVRHGLPHAQRARRRRDLATWGCCWAASRSAPVLQHVTTACHHCLEPACMIACPVNAYEKDPVTGIVKHLDDQCFGCQYCTLACPYDVPKYHAAKGIVRKCDMCSIAAGGWRAAGLRAGLPAPGDRDSRGRVSQRREDAEAAVFLPAAPDPRITFRPRRTRRAACFRATCCRPTISTSTRSMPIGRWW